MRSKQQSAGVSVLASALASDGKWPPAMRARVTGTEGRERSGTSRTSPAAAHRTARTASGEAIDGMRSFGTRTALAQGGAAKRFPIMVAVLSASVLGFELFRPVYTENPGVRAGLETAITLSALLSAYLLLVVFDHRRRLGDLLLLVALVALSLVDFAFVALPALAGSTLSHGVPALAWAVGSWSRSRSRRRPSRPARRSSATAVAQS